MFRSNDEEAQDNLSGVDETVIGHSIKIEGDLVSNGSIAVEGEVIGRRSRRLFPAKSREISWWKTSWN